MSLGRVVVGYRENDRRRLRITDQYGLQSTPVRLCIAGCGHPVYFVPSGLDAVRERDAEVICDDCYQHHKQDVIAEL